MPSDAPFRRLSSRQNPIVARVRALARGGVEDAVLLEGATLAAEASSAGWPIEIVAVTEAALAAPATRRLVEGLPPATDRILVTAAVMEAMSPVRTPSGLVAIARPAQSAGTRSSGPALEVCAAGVQDPGNLGAIVRVAEAAGATSFVSAAGSADPFGWKALRGAMGSAFRLPIARGLSMDDALAGARSRGLRVVATVLGGTPLHEVDLAVPTCLLFGSEGSGLPPGVADAADVRLAIPMQPPVESLNVAAAAAVVLYEARRQRAAVRRDRA